MNSEERGASELPEVLASFDTSKLSSTGRAARKIGMGVLTGALPIFVVGSLLRLDWLKSAGSWLFLVGIICFGITGTSYLGFTAGQRAFYSQASFVLKRIFLMLFLPAVLIVALIMVILLLVHAGPFAPTL